jgi:hypothetical protein
MTDELNEGEGFRETIRTPEGEAREERIRRGLAALMGKALDGAERKLNGSAAYSDYGADDPPDWSKVTDYPPQAQQAIDEGDEGRWHGEVSPSDSRAWVIQDLVPEVGKGLIAGQWGTYNDAICFCCFGGAAFPVCEATEDRRRVGA